MEAELKATQASLAKIKAKYPTRTPVLIEYTNVDTKVVSIIKILAHDSQEIDELIVSARRTTDIDKTDDLFLCVDGYEIRGNKTIKEATEDHGVGGILKCKLWREHAIDEEEKKSLGNWIILG